MEWKLANMSAGDDLRTSLLEMLGEFGRAMSIERVTPGAYDQSTGATAAETTTTYAGMGRAGNYRDALVDGVMIKQQDRRVTFVPDDPTFIPAANDRLVSDSTYVVIRSDPREIGGEWISFTLQVRR